MAQIVNRLPQTLMGELYMSVRSPVDPPLCSPPGAGRVKQVSITAPCLPARNIATWAAAPAQSNGQQLGSAASPSADRPSSSVVHNSAAARYASARHVVVQHKQAKQVTQRGTTEQPAVEPERPLQQLKEQKQKHSSSSCRSRQQHQQKKQLATVDVAHGRQRRPLETQGEQHPSKIQQHVQQQLLQHRQLRQQQDSPFANALSLYKMYACSHSMVEWQEAAYGLQRLAKRVSSPLQAQQVWQVAAALQAQPLHKQCARVLGGAVVELTQVTLRNHDLSILQSLIASHPTLQFSFNKRHIDKLLLAAVAADVSLEELQALLDLVPAAMLSNRSYFVLIKSFIARQQVAEAAHCFHQMEVAGLHLTPALQQLEQQLKGCKGGQQLLDATTL